MHKNTSTSRYFSITGRIGSIPELDGLRGIAIILVLFRHAVHPAYIEDRTLLTIGSWDLAVPFLNGWMGVDLFFVLSGFLITHHLLRRWPAEFNGRFMRRYWAKRVLRTFPAYFAAVGIALAGLVPFFDSSVDDVRYSLLVHLLFLQDYLSSDLVAAFWSLGVEEKFYLTCPFVLLAIHRLRFSWRISILLAFALLPAVLRIATIFLDNGQYLNYADFFWTVRSPFHLAMDGLWIGVICALIYKNQNARQFLSKSIARRICYTSLAVLMLMLFSRDWFGNGSIYAAAVVLSLLAIAFGGLLMSAIVSPTIISRPLRAKWLRAVSTISYSVYLLHLMLVPWSQTITDQIIGDALVSPAQRLLISIPVFFAMSFLAGCVLHFSVEKPFLVLKDKIRI